MTNYLSVPQKSSRAKSGENVELKTTFCRLDLNSDAADCPKGFYSSHSL
jgi:hypothetical protein